MSTFFYRHRAIGDADDPILVDDDDEMFGKAELMDLISHAKELSVDGYMEKKEVVVFKLFTLWRATSAMSIETRTKILQDARSHLFKDDLETDDDNKRKPKFKSDVARTANGVLGEMMRVNFPRLNDFTYDDIARNFW